MSSRASSEKGSDDDREYLPYSSSSEQETLKHNPWTTAVLVVCLGCAIIASLISTVFLEHQSQAPYSKPTLTHVSKCRHATARPSWHDLPLHRRHGYIRAVQRLADLPSRLGLNTSLYDDFTHVHLQTVWDTHHAAISLPYHRYFLHVFEQALQNEGGYDGPMPYWDWTRDATSPLESPIWDQWAGFGGNGSVDGCIEGGLLSRIGKLANYTESGFEPHCVRRNFADDQEYGLLHSNEWSRPVVESIVKSSKTYDDFRLRIESGPHKHLHEGVGGEMPTAMSTNDNLFFLHHAQIDRLWWLWQQEDPGRRDIEFFGPVRDLEGHIQNSDASIVDSIRLKGLSEDVMVMDVMRTETGLLCYKYKQEL